MAHTQTLETWMEIFSLVETATERHDAAARLESLASSSHADVRPGLLSRARVQRRLGDEAMAAAEQLRWQRYDDLADVDLTNIDLTRVRGYGPLCAVQQVTAAPGSPPMRVPRHEWPGRIVFTVGLAMSLTGVALLIALWPG